MYGGIQSKIKTTGLTQKWCTEKKTSKQEWGQLSGRCLSAFEVTLLTCSRSGTANALIHLS